MGQEANKILNFMFAIVSYFVPVIRKHFLPAVALSLQQCSQLHKVGKPCERMDHQPNYMDPAVFETLHPKFDFSEQNPF
jgi:hypothetical protein